MVAVAGVVFAVVLFALVRYRRRGDEWPRGKDEAKVPESLYAVLLAVIAVALIAATYRTEARVDRVSAHPQLRIDVTAFQWQWRFDYPDSRVSVIGSVSREPQLVVPVHRDVQFIERSADVIHSFWVPSERFKRDAFPNRTTRFDLAFPRIGTFPGRCAEFCGLHHADMNFSVKVVSEADFKTWLGAHS